MYNLKLLMRVLNLPFNFSPQVSVCLARTITLCLQHFINLINNVFDLMCHAL